MTADKHSGIWVFDTFLDLPIDDKKRYTVHETVDDEKLRKGKDRTRWRFPEEVELLGDVGRTWWGDRDPSVRGFVVSK